MTESTSKSSGYNKAVEQELAALEEDLLWTEKAHFAAAESLARVNFWVGIVATIAASVAAATVLADATPVIAGIAALIAAIASGLLTFLKPTEAENNHLDAGRKLGALRVRVRQALRLDLFPDLDTDPQELRGLVLGFAAEKAEIDKDAPATSGRAFSAARKKIEAGHFQHADEANAG
ncbi:hypothetical protein GCM10010413_10090 [Promicromonospora sukumoe]|uniref:SMODS and SLOG-associating 2TM effector domain-containing protein n=1 Tax=Promicromonospora sukumoe TaxID=88382 RepID=A0A7W3J5G8_9MICO|nr:SLATT domain-containing protein [Promicromonospora sukumoe]MBA8806676.1 hypothetical protein [Promicromonospora sukumoe]